MSVIEDGIFDFDSYNEEDIKRAKVLALSAMQLDEDYLVSYALRSVSSFMADLEMMRGTEFMSRMIRVMLSSFEEELEGGDALHMAYQTFKELETL